MAKVLSPKTNGKGVPSPLKNNLWWPGTPTKKGKIRRNVAKLPAVISGNEWQRIEEKKRAEKKEEMKKEERKRLREEKKLSKTGGKKKSRKRAVFDEEEDWIIM